MSNAVLYEGDCLEVMPTLPENSVDTIITDPPYGLEFMGKDWDKGVPGAHFWQAAMRVAKPGALLLAFGGTRTWHRLACAIEDAGWEIRDTIMWVYGSGFPKSMNISKAIDATIRCGGSNTRRLRQTEQETGGAPYTLKGTNNGIMGEERVYERKEWEPTTPLAQLWNGWGTALKPAWEPIIVAMKPLDGTYAQNALTWGVAGLWIDGGRVGSEIHTYAGSKTQFKYSGNGQYQPQYSQQYGGETVTATGRWPANFIHDGSDEVLAGMGSAARFFYCAKASKRERDAGCEGMPETPFVQFQTGNGASGKPSSISEGRETAYRNSHPTVKPLALMRYLCRLTKTPTGGVVLDPFMGSGSTGCAAVLEGRDFIGIEMDAQWVEVAKRRIEHWQEQYEVECNERA